ncbi:hypothetical protein ES705_49181 [subsurface metagenome]
MGCDHLLQFLIDLSGNIEIGQTISIVYPEFYHSRQAKLLAANMFFAQIGQVPMINLNMAVNIIYTRVLMVDPVL